jgi:hypothetical protein
MTGRDRLVLMVLAVLAVLGGGWLLAVSPERKRAAQEETQVTSAREQLTAAEAQAQDARAAQARYAEDYASVVRLGKAVPPLDEVPALVYELDHVTHQREIDFNSISSGSGSGSASSSASAGGAAASAVTPAAFTQMPFTFVFKGTFFALAHLLGQIDGFAQAPPAGSSGTATAADRSAGQVQVRGRLLTIQSVDLAVESGAAAGAGAGKAASGSSSHELTATITATAYVLPVSQGLTAGATPSGPAGTSAAAQDAGATATSTPAAPAVIKGAP